MSLLEDARSAASLLRERAYVRLAARAEGDAVCTTALLAHALRREGIDFHATWAPRLSPDLSRALAEERNDAIVLVGLGGDGVPVEDGKRVSLDRGSDALAADVTLA